MDAFEQLAADIFWNEGYWVRTSVKVELTRDEKIRIGRHSSPRWEIDLIADRATTNELLALECKSYLDSGGVHAAHFNPGHKLAHRYKLFHDPLLRDTVLERLRLQCIERGLCPLQRASRRSPAPLKSIRSPTADAIANLPQLAMLNQIIAVLGIPRAESEPKGLGITR